MELIAPLFSGAVLGVLLSTASRVRGLRYARAAVDLSIRRDCTHKNPGDFLNESGHFCCLNLELASLNRSD